MEKIPILRMGRFLLVTIQVDMHDRLAMQLQDDLTDRIVQDRAHGVLIDISSLEVVDSFIGRMISNIAAMARVLDAQTVVVGMQPAVAITLVELGLSLEGVRTALNVDKGMALLRDEVSASGTSLNARTRRLRRHGRLDRIRPADPLVGRRRARAPADARARRRAGLHARGPDEDRHRGQRARAQHARVRRRRRSAPSKLLNDGARKGVRLTFTDQGPGIADIDLALKDGYTTGSGLGLGLSGARRLSNEFSIESKPGEGTRVAITRWR